MELTVLTFPKAAENKLLACPMIFLMPVDGALLNSTTDDCNLGSDASHLGAQTWRVERSRHTVRDYSNTLGEMLVNIGLRVGLMTGLHAEESRWRPCRIKHLKYKVACSHTLVAWIYRWLISLITPHILADANRS